ncbi:hypothetical protein FACS1894163_09450 [Spirochaetia bacterium]|nr:hypothetical protein FACS1894163_09450 [Spirochaetia bacterium]
MAKRIVIEFNDEKINAKDGFIADFQKAIQSANINFLIGSGCSVPSISALKGLENKIEKLRKENKSEEADKCLHDFICSFVEHYEMASFPDENFTSVLENYKQFVEMLLQILFERKSNILHKQTTVFTTNYDLFFELAFEDFADSMTLFDGFKRLPSVNQYPIFSISEFFNTIFNTGNLYKYRVEVPSCNLIKLHGSLNWYKENGKIIESFKHIDDSKALKSSSKQEDIRKFNDLFSIILPQKDKFRETLLNQTYYDLLRIFSNELDKENTLLIVSGFSFADEHLREIITRALRNPTLKIIIFCYAKDEVKSFNERFKQYNNVEIVYSLKDNIDLTKVCAILKAILPSGKDRIENDEKIDKE